MTDRQAFPPLPVVDVVDPFNLSTMGSFTLQGDIRSYAWDGGGSLGAGADPAATAGFFLDSSAGAAQFVGKLFIGGPGGDLVEIDPVGWSTSSGFKFRRDGDLVGDFYAAGDNNTNATMHWRNLRASGGSIQIGVKAGDDSPAVNISGGLDATGGRIRTDFHSAASPSFSFVSDPDTGIYRSGVDALGISAGGGFVVSFHSGGGAAMQARSGTALLPAYSFTSDADTGMYLVAAGNIGLSIAGTQEAELAAAGAGYTSFGIRDSTLGMKRLRIGADGSGPGGTGRAIWCDA